MTEVPDKRTHAQRRRDEAQEGARLKLWAGHLIWRLKRIAEKAETVDPAKIPALRLKADVYTRLLAKCLPDLKAIEHTGDMTHRHVEERSTAEIRAELEESRAELARVRAILGETGRAPSRRASTKSGNGKSSIVH